jgi:hypothetical protein
VSCRSRTYLITNCSRLKWSTRGEAAQPCRSVVGDFGLPPSPNVIAGLSGKKGSERELGARAWSGTVPIRNTRIRGLRLARAKAGEIYFRTSHITGLKFGVWKWYLPIMECPSRGCTSLRNNSPIWTFHFAFSYCQYHRIFLYL